MMSTPAFVGRVPTCRLLDGMIDAASGGGSAGVVLGEPGIGKTALLRRLAERSAWRVFWIRGLEAETVLPYEGAADLLTPLVKHFDCVPPAQRHALEIALAIIDGEVSSHLAVCAAALGVLAAAGDHEPLVVLVDDLQWVDAESRRLLLFVARRLSSERVTMILARRDHPGGTSWNHDLPTVHLVGLSVAECEELAVQRHLAVATGRLRHVVRATGGNPLAVLENLSRSGPDGWLDADEGVAVGPHLQQVWQRILERLPGPTRHALFLIAVARDPGLPALPHLLAALELRLDDLGPAEEQGLVVLEEDRLDLRHPLLRQVLMDVTPLAVRVATYRALAALASREQRPWYLSLAVLGMDDELASTLETAAGEARERGGHSASAQLLKRAADLSTQPQCRAERLLAAGGDALLAGDAASAEQWCGQAITLETSPAFVTAATMVRGAALTWMGHPAAACAELIRTADSIEPFAPPLAAELYCAATMPAGMTGDVKRSRSASERGVALLAAAGVPPSFNAYAMCASARILDGALEEGREHLRSGLRLLPGIDQLKEQQALAVFAQAHAWSEQFDQARRLIDTTIDLARAQGAPQILAYALAVRAELSTRTGQWTGAYADSFESLQWAEEMQQHGTIGFSLVVMGRIEAARGQGSLAEERIDRCRREVGPYGIDCLLFYEPAVLGLAALTAGDPDLAVEHLEGAWLRAAEVGLGNPGAVPFVADLAEAHIRCGQPARALELIAWLDERARLSGLAYPAMGADRCRGLLASNPDEAVTAFEAAGRRARAGPLPFELARTLLCEGEVLRRGRRSVAARVALREAQRLFDGLGARPWSDRAARELAASGDRSRPPSPQSIDLDVLTPQELQVSRMIASGRNNSEAVTALFVSRKTVETHLTRVYRKLGVRSRSELTAVILAHSL